MNWTLHCGDARTVLANLPAESVNCVVTSPPYWGLRDYGTSQWNGGDPACDHLAPMPGVTGSSGLANYENGLNAQTTARKVERRQQQYRALCRRCGAVRIDQQIGLEKSPDAFVAALVEVFAGVRRVLRDDGVCWLNLGDSYAGAKTGNTNGGSSSGLTQNRPNSQDACNARLQAAMSQMAFTKPLPDGFKPKDLIGIPWRVAFALQADGWYLRSDVIWAKPNPMPESVTDRPTKAHEYVFLLTKSERYAYDADAIRLRVTEAMLQQMAQGYDGEGLKDYNGAGVQNPSEVKQRIIKGQRRRADNYAGTTGANARTVWHIATEPSPYEHFAVMPKALARKCILAGSPFGGVVCDPFAGVATTGVVALEEGRSFIGVELSPKYHAMARERLANVAPLLATEVPA